MGKTPQSLVGQQSGWSAVQPIKLPDSIAEASGRLNELASTRVFKAAQLVTEHRDPTGRAVDVMSCNC